MNLPRIIPCLLLKGEGLFKGVKFSNYKYIGDPINAVKIFNDKEVDELLFLDIAATAEGRGPNIELLRGIADECFMPFGVGGGINTIGQIRSILENGAEKVSINTAAINNPEFIRQASNIFGSQSITVCIDVKKKLLGKAVFSHSGKVRTALDPVEWAKMSAEMGAGEIMVNSIDCDGTMSGYDLDLIREISEAVSIPVIACGGAGNLVHIKSACDAGASAAAAGSMFVFMGKLKGVMINYPSVQEIQAIFSKDPK